MQPKMQFAVPVFMGRNLTAAPAKSKGRRSAPAEEVFARLLRGCSGCRRRSGRIGRCGGRRCRSLHSGGDLGAGEAGSQALAGGLGHLLVATVSGVRFIGAFAALLTSGTAQTAPPFIPTIIGEGGQDWPAVAAGTTIFLVPILVFTILLRKQLLRGITFGAVRK